MLVNIPFQVSEGILHMTNLQIKSSCSLPEAYARGGIGKRTIKGWSERLVREADLYQIVKLEADVHRRAGKRTKKGRSNSRMEKAWLRN